MEVKYRRGGGSKLWRVSEGEKECFFCCQFSLNLEVFFLDSQSGRGSVVLFLGFIYFFSYIGCWLQVLFFQDVCLFNFQFFYQLCGFLVGFWKLLWFQGGVKQIRQGVQFFCQGVNSFFQGLVGVVYIQLQVIQDYVYLGRERVAVLGVWGIFFFVLYSQVMELIFFKFLSVFEDYFR